jgi:transposase
MVYGMAPMLPGFRIESIEIIDNEYIIVSRAMSPAAECPDCGQVSSKVHSWYERNPRDLPSSGISVRLSLQVRKFFCHSLACARQVFCERLPLLIQKYARRTKRLAETLTILAFALGGKEGERIVVKIGMPASRDTLLRLIRKQADAQLPDPRVIGVDDWAMRKGHIYGTILCDLEQGTVIDLLPDREAETLAEWLKVHPTVEIVTRDRSKAYAAGVTEGAPDAIQVADRWHLANNLVEAIESTLAQHPSRLQGMPVQQKGTTASSERPAKTNEQSTVKEDMLVAREAKRAMRRAQYEQVTALRQRSVRKADIANQVGISLRTINRWLAHGSFPERKPRASQPTKIDPYRTYVQQRWQEGCHNLAQIHREIEQQGYTGVVIYSK